MISETNKISSNISLSDRKWKTFKIPSLFNVTAGVYYSDSEYNEGNTPYVSASAENNGIGKWIDIKADFAGNMIITGKIGCVAFYQKDPFCATSDVNVLIPKFNMNESVGIFIVRMINSNNFKWDYNRQCRQGDMKRMSIQLPINSSGEPDYQFMEDYINYIKNQADITDLIEIAGDESPEKLRWLNNNIDIADFKKFLKSSNDMKIQNSTIHKNNNLSNLSNKKWKEFRLANLFNCRMGNGIDASKVTVSDTSQINYVSRSSNNNGIIMKVDKIDSYEPYEAGKLTLALGGEYLGSCFVQPEEFYTAQNVAVLECNEEISLKAKQFIATMVRNEAKIKYFAFGRELNTHFKTDFTIPLPVDSKGNPDYQFMEDYINQIENNLTL